MKSRVHPTYKTKYRVANWASYDRALVGRGDVTLWLAPEAIDAWAPGRVGTRGGQFKYSDLAIETALTLRLIFHLPLRQAEGFLNSLFGMMGIDRSAPDHTTLSRRSQHLDLTRRPWRTLEAVEFATLTWVDWFNTRRLLGPLGDIPPAEFEAQYSEQAEVA